MAAPIKSDGTDIEEGDLVVVYGLKRTLIPLPNKKLTLGEKREFFTTFGSSGRPNDAVYVVCAQSIGSYFFRGDIVEIHKATNISGCMTEAIAFFASNSGINRRVFEFDYEQIIDPNNCVYLGTDKSSLPETSFVPKYRF